MADPDTARPPLDVDRPALWLRAAISEIVSTYDVRGTLDSYSVPAGDDLTDALTSVILARLQARSPAQEPRSTRIHPGYWNAATPATATGTEPLREALRAMVERHAPHKGSCCTFDDGGRVIVTPESCVCPPMHKEARAALEAGDSQ